MRRSASSSGKVVAGLIIILVGTLLLLRQLGFYLPHWLFTWPMILIIVGLINGAKHGFKNFGWLFLVGLGTIFLLDRLYPIYNVTHYAWPLLIIFLGVFIIFGRTKSCQENNGRWPGMQNRRDRWQQPTTVLPSTDSLTTDQPPTAANNSTSFSANTENQSISSEFINVNAVLAGIKRNIYSKNITGADINAFLGGAELNLTQADIQGKVFMDINLVMAGCKLIVPSNWVVISEVTALLGGVDDKRLMVPPNHQAPTKTLILKGVTIMGGIEIQSYM